MTDGERRARICKKCKYHGYVAGITIGYTYKGETQSVHCDYIGHTGHKRPCRPEDCVKEGVFEPSGRRRKKIDGQSTQA